MLKKNWLKILISSLVTLSPIAFGLAVWNKLPETMSTHWGISGEADGFSSRTFAVFGLPLILLALNFICIVTSFFDKKNRGTKVHNIIYYIIPVISLFTNAMVYSAAFEKTWDFAAIIPLVLGLLFAVMGNLMPKVRQNKTLGFKLKWTLQSEANWNATHRFGGKIMVLAGILILFTMLLPTTAMMITVLSVIFASLIIIFIYSYRFYKAELENEDTEFEPIYNTKAYKIASIISAILVLVILGSTAYIMLSGNITVTYTDDSFTVDSEYYDPLTLNFTDIRNVDFYDEMEIGTKQMGFNSATLSIGKFKNKALGEHTRYTYNKCSAVIVIESDGKLLVINAKTAKATKEIYNHIVGKVHSDSGFIGGEGEEI